MLVGADPGDEIPLPFVRLGSLLPEDQNRDPVPLGDGELLLRRSLARVGERLAVVLPQKQQVDITRLDATEAGVTARDRLGREVLEPPGLVPACPQQAGQVVPFAL